MEQQQKLAALKAWTHYDGLSFNSYKTLADPLLYNTIYSHSAPKDVASSPAAIEDVSDSEFDLGATKKKAPVRPATVDSDDDDDTRADRVMDSAGEEDEAELSEEEAKVQKKGKGKAKGKKVIPASSRGLVSQDAKQYSLAKIAKQGGTGRVMFAFEKVSSSKLITSREGSVEEGKLAKEDD